MSQALKGIRVIDMTHNQAGPACAQILGFLGADVIKLEEPKGGDVARTNMRDIKDSDSLFFLVLNANKQSLTLNLKTDEGKALFRKIVEQSDVLLENFGPGALDRLGLGWKDLEKINPRLVFERLFGDGGTNEQRAQRAREDRSILDYVNADFARLSRSLSASDRSHVDDYLASVREVERRIETVEKLGDAADLPALDRPRGIPEVFGDHVKLMYELQWLAFQADLTRVITFMLGRELNFRTYPEIGIAQGHHTLSHHQDRPDLMERYAKLNTYQTQLFAAFIEKLATTREAEAMWEWPMSRWATVSAERLRQLPLLAELDAPQLDALAKQFQPEMFQAEREVFHEGDPGDRFYLIARGEVEVFGPESDRRIASATRCAIGSWRMLRELRTASVAAIESVITISSSGDLAMRSTAWPDRTL